jgi:hypothetical protein
MGEGVQPAGQTQGYVWLNYIGPVKRDNGENIN